MRSIGRDLSEGSVVKGLLVFALPMILTNLVQQLYSAVDLSIIGLYVGNIGTVGVATGSEFLDFMTPLSMSFCMGGQIYMSQLAGQKNDQKIRETAGTLFTIMMGFSLLCIVFAALFHIQLLEVLNCPMEAMSQATDYMIITAIGMPFVCGYNALCALLRAKGESRAPLLFVIGAAIMNVVGDLFFTGYLHMEASGVAIATVLAQATLFIIASLYVYRYFDIRYNRQFIKIHKQSCRVIIKLGVPQIIRSLSVHGSMLWVKSNVNTYGVVASATYSVGNKIEKLMNVFVWGVDHAAGAMIGQSFGAKKIKRINRVIYSTLACSLSLGIVILGLFWSIPEILLGAFTTNEEVITMGVIFLRIVSIGCLTSSIANSFKAIITGVGAANLSFAVGVLDGISRILVCIIFFYIFDQGLQSYFWGAALCHLLPGLVAFIYFKSGIWKKKKLLSEA